MISTHEFNTSWIGEPVGIINDNSFFEQPMPVKKAQLNQFLWVAYRNFQRNINIKNYLNQLGFMYVDTTQHCSGNLSQFKNTPPSPSLTIKTGGQFSLKTSRNEMRSFIFERFRLLPNINQTKIDDRYFNWMVTLLQNQPKHAIEISKNNQVQGWYFGEERKNSLYLCLAALNNQASIKGTEFYTEAVKTYARMGVQNATASFSITNLPVHNMLSRFGFVFEKIEDIYFYINPDFKAYR